MIYATVGTMFLDFPRLILKMDEIARDTGEKVIIQVGLGATIPRHCEYFDFKPRSEVLAIQREARVIVCHAGIGSVIDALQANRPIIVVPRRKAMREHMTDHQMDLAEAVRRRGWGRTVLDIEELPRACAEPPAPPVDYAPARGTLVFAVREMVDKVCARKYPREWPQIQETRR
jgi:UDP-N-acetylglucosamine transferase subunit ALG13